MTDEDGSQKITLSLCEGELKMCVPSEDWSDWASVQADQSLHFALCW